MFKKQEAFTLIEMLIVLMIITVLILLIVPSMAKRTEEVHDKGCKALQKSVQAQVHVYQLERGKDPEGIGELIEHDYISEDQQSCKNGKELRLEGGVVTIGGD